MFDEAAYEEVAFPLISGDRILFYSDGMVEQMNDRQELFTLDRFRTAIAEAASVRVEDIAGTLADRTLAWGGSPHPGDDLSVLAVEFR